MRVIESDLRVLRGVSVDSRWIRLSGSLAATIIKVDVAIENTVATSISASDAAYPFWRTFKNSLTVGISRIRVRLIDYLAVCVAADQPVHISLLSTEPLNPRSVGTCGVKPV